MQFSHSGAKYGQHFFPAQFFKARRRDLVERIESRGGLRQLEYMKIMGMGSGKYDLLSL